MTVVNLIFAPQEHDQANHQGLWKEIGKQSTGTTIVINIGADMVVSVLRRRLYRISEALRSPVKQVESYRVVRPLYILRPEVAGRRFNHANMWILRILLNRLVPDLDTSSIRILIYLGEWAETVRRAFPDSKIYYYLLDEVARTASSDEFHAARARSDVAACELSENIFLMSTALLVNRKEFAHKCLVLGNGAFEPSECATEAPVLNTKLEKSVGLIGNIRDWIDARLLEELVDSRQDLHFGLLGNIEANMLSFVQKLCNGYENVEYYGSVSKSDVGSWYSVFDVSIVPYQQNSFMFGTRPIKVVESIFAGTPVVSIPVSGYEESSFIRFARSAQQFSEQIDLASKIDRKSSEYLEFVENNSWKKIGSTIIRCFGEA